MPSIDLSEPEAVRKATDAQVKRRARLFLECAIENALAAHDGDGEAVATIVAEMIDHMRRRRLPMTIWSTSHAFR